MLAVTPAWLLAFLLVLTRVGGVVALTPLPGARNFPATAKAALAVLLAALLAPPAQVQVAPAAGAWTFAAAIFREAGLGVAIGLALLWLTEMLGFAAQLLGFQAGYSYINSVDPATQVDATILNVVLTLLGGLLVFALEVHLHVLRALALSLERIPAGTFALRPRLVLELVSLGSTVFETAVRLAFPVVAVLLLLDLALALLSYVNARMQLLTLAFPVKMVVGMLTLSTILLAAPHVFGRLVSRVLPLVYALASR
jgi:flagellar biosynthetic protein FliR